MYAPNLRAPWTTFPPLPHVAVAGLLLAVQKHLALVNVRLAAVAANALPLPLTDRPEKDIVGRPLGIGRTSYFLAFTLRNVSFTSG